MTIHSLRFVERTLDNGDGTVSTVKILQAKNYKDVCTIDQYGTIYGTHKELGDWQDVPLVHLIKE